MGVIIQLVLVSAILGAIVAFIYNKRKKQYSETLIEHADNFEKLVSLVTLECAEITKEDTNMYYKDVEYEANMRTREVLDDALKNCVDGNDRDRETVISLVREILAKHLVDQEAVNNIIDFSDLRLLEPRIKFEILAWKYGKDVIHYLDDIYRFSDLRKKDGDDRERRFVDYELMDKMFDEQFEDNELNYEDSLDILAILVYSNFKGFGIVDTLIGLNIDGMELGTSGSTRYLITGDYDKEFIVTKSVWIQIKASWIHLSFFDLGSIDELRRLVINISNTPGSKPLVEKGPLKVVERFDGSRIAAVRPSVGSTWSIYVRKFGGGFKSVRQWLSSAKVDGCELVEELLYYLAQAEETVPFTGLQNTGKTTLMKGFIENFTINNIRVFEMSFESELNELYPDRNIGMYKPTEFASNNEVQDFMKKVDGYLVYVGEVAEARVGVNTLQFANIAASCVMFSNHAKDDKALIDYFAGCMTAVEGYGEKRAQEYTLDAIKHNVHIDFHNKSRVIDYISEIVKGELTIPYPEVPITGDIAEAIKNLADLQREYYTRTTDRVTFESRKIIVFNKTTGRYEPNEWYSPMMFERILNKLPDEEKGNFIEFYKKNWGAK